MIANSIDTFTHNQQIRQHARERQLRQEKESAERRSRIALAIGITAVTAMATAYIAVSIHKDASTPPYERLGTASSTQAYVVKQGDTLWDIATRQRQENLELQNHTTSEIVQGIDEYNHLNDGKIYPGDKLTLPGDKQILTKQCLLFCWAHK